MNGSAESHTTTPLYNIGAVARMTGIPGTTLRIWERRYNFPSSARTAGGHRLYSQHEVERLHWVKARVDGGMQVSQAVRALKQMEQAGRLVTPPRPATALHEEELHSARVLRRRLLQALLAHDAVRADETLAEATVILSPEALILDVVGPTLHEIGTAWSDGRADVATEHFASAHLRQHLVMWLRTAPPARPVAPVLLACAPGELHEGGLLMLAVLLRRLRWPVLYLGQTMPLSELASLVREVEPSALVFVAMMEEPARNLAAWPTWLPGVARTGRPVVAYAGRAFSLHPNLVPQVPGVYLGPTLREGVQKLDAMLLEEIA